MVEEHELRKEKIQEDYNDKYWDQRYTVVQRQIPSFLQKMAGKVLSTGDCCAQAWACLSPWGHLSSDTSCSGSVQAPLGEGSVPRAPPPPDASHRCRVLRPQHLCPPPLLLFRVCCDGSRNPRDT